MTFRTYWLNLNDEQRLSLAEKCDTTVGHLRNIAYGKKCGESLAINIERESVGKVRVEDLRADVDWAYLRGTSCVDGQNADDLKAA